MATLNDKLEQQNAQTRELTDEELDQAAGGDVDHPLEVVIDLGPSIPQPEPAHVVSGVFIEKQ